MKLAFHKMQGLGNDFVVVDVRGGGAVDWSAVSGRLLDRRLGIGADSLLVLEASDRADARMRTFERDGRESEMCGNGIRCAAKLLWDGNRHRNHITFETPAGLREVVVEDGHRMLADMGEPSFPIGRPGWGERIEIDGRVWALHPLSMGNPHVVIFVDSKDEVQLIGKLGPVLERHVLFPEGTNVAAAFCANSSEVAARVWERSAGATPACGTGACAVAVAAIRNELARSPVCVRFEGGALEIRWNPGETVKMTGPAESVFSGEVDL